MLALSACSAIMGNVEDVRAIEFTDTDAWTYADYVTVTPERGEPLTVHLPGAEGFAEALTTQWEKVRAQR